MTDLTDQSVKSLGRTVRDGDAASLLELKGDRGHRRKTAGMEDQILAELEIGKLPERKKVNSKKVSRKDRLQNAQKKVRNFGRTRGKNNC